MLKFMAVGCGSGNNVRSIYDLMGVVVVVVVLAATQPVSSCSLGLRSAPLVVVDYPLPDFSLNFLVRGAWLEHIFGMST